MLIPPITARVDYVLILEWLNATDQKTGQELYDFLKQKGTRSVLVRCNNKSDVSNALQKAAFLLPVKGVPIVHIESHGDDPDRTSMDELAFGSEAVPGIPWMHLGDWLAPLNAASGHRVLVIGATCFGYGLLASMRPDRAAPFAACIGLTSNVLPGSLLNSMKELYRRLLEGISIQDAVESANRELHVGEQLRVSSAVEIAIRILGTVYSASSSADALQVTTDKMLKKLRNSGVPVPIELEDVAQRIFLNASKQKIEHAWNSWFPLDLQQAKDVYRLNWKLIEIAAEQLSRPS